MKKHSTGKHKPYNSPGHVADHPANMLPDPSGGMMQGDVQPGMPLGPMGSMGGAPDQATQGTM
jgi:hypothetical protein